MRDPKVLFELAKLEMHEFELGRVDCISNWPKHHEDYIASFFFKQKRNDWQLDML